MCRSIKIISLLTGTLLVPFLSFSQFEGGNADGYNGLFPGFLQINPQQAYCQGGAAEGCSNASTALITMNQQQFYCLGGNLDGYFVSALPLESLNNQAEYCISTVADGYHFSSFAGYFHDASFYCGGGNTDGWTTSLFEGTMFDQVSCFGGSGDGSMLVNSGSRLMGYGIWTGSVSSSWWAQGNWKHNTVPATTANILIPSGADFYPEVTDSLAINFNAGTIRCKRLDVSSGGQITLAGGTVISGLVLIDGMLTFVSVNSRALTILPEGILKVSNDGVVHLELP